MNEGVSVAKPNKDSEWLLMSPPIAKLWAMEHAPGRSDRRIRLSLWRKPTPRVGNEDPRMETGAPT
jgi:hypothetical protein